MTSRRDWRRCFLLLTITYRLNILFLLRLFSCTPIKQQHHCEDHGLRFILQDVGYHYQFIARTRDKHHYKHHYKYH